MPASTRTMPAASAKAIVRRAMVRAGARSVGQPPARITRFAGAERVLSDVTTTLDALVSDGDATDNGGLYALTGQGLVKFREHPSPRGRYSS